MTYDNLSERQQQILEYIKFEMKDKRYPPTVREICDAVGLSSSSTSHGHLEKLEKKGYIKKDPTKPRAIEVVHHDCDNNNLVHNQGYVRIPVVGKVTAGQPILATENIEDTFAVPLDYISDGTYFMLTIKGNSMIKAGIMDGDYVLVKQEHTAEDGDIVVALIDDEATVKRFYKEENYIRLQPENPDMEPTIVNDVRILGLVKGVFRKL